MVGNTTIWHHYVALTAALHFATRHRNSRGKPLLLSNPLNGVRVSKTVSPARPVADDRFYEALPGNLPVSPRVLLRGLAILAACRPLLDGVA
jgi:hypothetical protein